MRQVGFIYSDRFLEHVPPEPHPERAERLVAVIQHLKSHPVRDRLKWIEPVAAEERWIEAVHSRAHVDRVEQASKQGEPLDPDTYACPASFEVALLAAGAGITACDAVMSGQISSAFCAVRPPGHHAESNRAMGFCLFNNVAVAARYLQRAHGIERVLIVDWDVHHGNGTQHIFDDDPTVFYFSTHQYPYYPGTGRANDAGSGKGRGYTLNLPMEAGGGDREYIEVFETKLLPAAERFAPQFVLISAGFDAHQSDPLAHMSLTESGFSELTRLVRRAAGDSGRIVSMLEGGYDLHALPRSVAAHLEALASAE